MEYTVLAGSRFVDSWEIRALLELILLCSLCSVLFIKTVQLLHPDSVDLDARALTLFGLNVFCFPLEHPSINHELDRTLSGIHRCLQPAKERHDTLMM